MTVECSENDWFDYTKSCPDCRGGVHAHLLDESEDGYTLQYHCHKCGTFFTESDWDEMKEIRNPIIQR